MSENDVTMLYTPMKLEYTVTAGSARTEFLEALVDRRLVGRRCPTCTKVYIPPRGCCPTCGELTTESVDVAHVGTLTTFCVIRIPFEGQVLEPPYVAGSILLDGADIPLFHLVGGISVDEVRMGMRVKAVWDEQRRPHFASVRFFEPTGEPDVPTDQLQEHL
jgi:hypothetical protein